MNAGPRLGEAAVPTPGGSPRRVTEPRWDLAFLGILAYLVIEYTRLPLMFPILQHLAVSKIAAGVAALGLVISARLKGRGKITSRIDICILLFLLASLVSAFFADYPQDAWNQLIDSAKWVVVYFLVSRIVTSSWRAKIFAVALLLLNLKLAQFAIRLYLQYGTMEQGGRSVAMVGLGSNDFFGNSNDFGVGMCVVLPLAVSLFMGESGLLARLTYLVSSLGIFAAMLLSGCRGAFAATCAAALIFFLRGNRRMAAVLLGLLFVLGTLFLLPKGNLDRLRSALSPEDDQTAAQRIGFWKAGFKMFAENPLTGVGPGNFAPNFRDHFGLAEKDPGAWAPHSIYIQGFAELGLLGAIPLFILWGSALRLNGLTRKRLLESGATPQSFELRLALGLELAIVAFLISGAFLTTLYYPHMWFLLGMSVGLHRAVLQSEMMGQELPQRAPSEDFVFAHSALPGSPHLSR